VREGRSVNYYGEISIISEGRRSEPGTLIQRVGYSLILSESIRMRAYSEDLRLKVLDAVDRGMPREEVARVFGISLPSIKRWLKRRRETGRVGAESPPGPPAIKGRMLNEWLPGHLRANPDLTLEEHRDAFEEAFGVKVSTATVSRAISGLSEGDGWPLKKSPE
jgi:transposase